MLKSGLYRMFERFARSLGILEMQSRLDRIEAHQLNLEAHHARLETSQQSLLQGLVEQSENAKTVIPMIQAVDRLNETRSRKLVLDAKLEIDNLLVHLRRDIDAIRVLSRSTSTTSTGDMQEGIRSTSSIDDALYVSLEDRFRGDVELITDRQREYLPFITDIVSDSTPLLDVGCGRGEWLDLLKSEGIPSRGVDSNQSAVGECHRKSLDVSNNDLLSTLIDTPSQSLGSVTMFQVLEHLPFDLVVDVLRESLRVLVPGGVFIGEVPNCETLRVGASTFWIDPTHQRPLYPAVLEFIASQVGFRSVTGRYSSPLAPTPVIDHLPEQVANIILDLHYRVNGPGDFAIIATA